MDDNLRNVVGRALWAVETSKRTDTGLSFAPGNSGPSFGPIQFDFGASREGTALIGRLMREHGFSAKDRDNIFKAADAVVSGATTSSGKLALFTQRVGDALYNRLVDLINNSQDDINAAASAHVSKVSGQVSALISKVQHDDEEYSPRELGVLDPSDPN
jgi:hypothetical protein